MGVGHQWGLCTVDDCSSAFEFDQRYHLTNLSVSVRSRSAESEDRSLTLARLTPLARREVNPWGGGRLGGDKGGQGGTRGGVSNH